ncbi:hypothetical protein V6N13_136646 [Hibiscus sabdariffa]
MQHRTGRLVGCFRKLQNWCLFSVIDEYQRFSGVKSHATDVIFTETFDATCLRQSFNSTIFLHQIYGTGKRQSLYRDFSLQLGQLPSASSSENLQHTNVNHQFYGTSCQNESATAGTQAPFSLLRSGSVPVGAYALQRENEFLERPGQLECQFYMKTGDYKSGAVCWFHHTRERVLPAPDCVLSPIGLPLCPVSYVFNVIQEELHIGQGHLSFPFPVGEVVKEETSSADEMTRILNCTDHYQALGILRHTKMDIAVLKEEYRKKADSILEKRHTNTEVILDYV